ncbi:hypothetical protein WJX73_007659 [Symbiochloris irregularis]|uniref:Uncharacterized protein n=1 Tax=Symbiochloris irregularis TaxID=706552 RepID=A0AAW1PA95_9CHLO
MSSGKRAAFIQQNGLAVLLKLLEEGNVQVAAAAVSMAAVLVSEDAQELQALSHKGIVPAVARYAAAQWPYVLRLRAATFLHNLCHAGDTAALLAITCGGVPQLAELVEPSLDNRVLTEMAVQPAQLRTGYSFDQPKQAATTGCFHGGLARLAAIFKCGSAGRAHSNTPQKAELTKQQRHLPAPSLASMLLQLGELLLLLVKEGSDATGYLATKEILQPLVHALLAMQPSLLAAALQALVILTTNAELLEPLHEAGAITVLPQCLALRRPMRVRMDALCALDFLCKRDCARQEAAAVAGVVPHLVALIEGPAAENQPPADQGNTQTGMQGAAEAPLKTPAPMRSKAIGMLVDMAHSTSHCLSLMAAYDVPAILLTLLDEQEWQASALEALAAWLAEEPKSIESVLLAPSTTMQIKVLFQRRARVGAAAETMCQMLCSLLRLLRRSPRFTVSAIASGLPGVLVQWTV